jgi:hypothetical protein
MLCAISGVDAGPGPAPGRREPAGGGGAEREVSGQLLVLQEDDFANHRSRRRFFLHESATGRRYELRLRPAPPGRPLRSGDQVVVRGLVGSGEIEAAAVRHSGTAAAVAASVSGVRPTVVLAVDFQDAAVACGDGALAGVMFSGARSVDGLYQSASSGALSFSGDADGDGAPDVFRVALASPAGATCDPFAWADAADAAAEQAGVALDLYDHRLYVLPGAAACPWAGLATLGCGAFCQAWVTTCDLPDVYAHELGHNLGMHHASTDEDNDASADCEYCDTSDFMGIGGLPWRELNGPHRVQLGWLPAQQIAVAGQSGDETLALSPLDEDPALAAFPQVLQVAVPGAAPYVLSYRRRSGYDEGLDAAFAGKTSIHRHPEGGATRTLLVAVLDDGEQFTDASAGIELTQLFHSDGAATLLVATGCATGTPSLVVEPPSRTAAPGVTVEYQVTLANEDSSACPPATFSLGTELPAGWTGEVAPGAIVLAAGGQATVTLAVGAAGDASDGDYALGLEVTGPHPDHQAAVSATLVVAGEPPQPPQGLAAKLIRGRTIRLDWEAAPSAPGSTFRIYRDGVLLHETARSHFMDRFLAAGQVHRYHLTAVDGAGRESAASTAVQVSVPSVPAGSSTSGPARGSVAAR